MVATAGVVPIWVNVPPAVTGTQVVLVVKVLVATLAQASVWSVPALGFGLTVTTTLAVSLQPAAF